ncbi:helix-turn-helix transcriptional regulator [Streptomyces sp. NBC_01500]|uniref:helix-turn-helix domain-containing protein n=1 Tax=Streptomyces sp. NBC_01500 TaxID=2903886 RepID=UPI00224C991B|nr:helix-turn-helix transcriptional regulator [Streptomyces sp. NBC_01500]MCX4548708.1 helix-turn-helix transcriptional regulator [Streptomyces sp. NBC_01500]
MVEARPNVHRRRFGSALRSLRHAVGYGMEEAAERLGLSGKPALSKIENGKQRVSGLGLTAFFQVYGVESEETRQKVKAMAALAASGRRTNLLDEFQDAIQTDAFEDYLHLEGMATEADVFFLQVIPGLLQTRAYATSIVERSKVWSSKREVDRFVDLRLARQAVLSREEPLNLWCILDEAALRRVVGGPKVMQEQLAWLLTVTEERKHVDVQVLPFDVGAHAGVDGSFQLLKFQVGSPVAVVEAKTTSLYLEDDVPVDRYQSAFDDLRKQALDPQASRRCIQKLIKDFET